ncbi:hypothetical protein VNO80_08014 [Phaseolus coccineus]|uniref:Uncharacterized protein n=1 Tax=Phaseolus coccineus TaxID=3886 RepID=A0AAN9RKE4_PHACN
MPRALAMPAMPRALAIAISQPKLDLKLILIPSHVRRCNKLVSSILTKGRPSIDALDTAKGLGVRSGKGSADPSSKSKKRPRKGSNIFSTTCSPGPLLTPPPRQEAIEMDSPSPNRAEKAIAPPETGRSMEVPMLPLAVLGGHAVFSGGATCTPRSHPRGSQDRDHHAKDKSRLEHELVEVSGSLKQSLAANYKFLERLAREVAEKKKAQQRTEAECRLVERVMVESTQLKKVVGERDEKISMMETLLSSVGVVRAGHLPGRMNQLGIECLI